LGVGVARADQGDTFRVSVADDGGEADMFSSNRAVSSDGRYIVFSSNATNLVEGDSNSHVDVFVRDRETGKTTRVSVASDGTQGDGSSDRAAVSASGRFVVFRSLATNLVNDDNNGEGDVFVHDRETAMTTRVSVASDGGEADGQSSISRISADGRLIVFTSTATNLVEGDSNQTSDVFVHDRETGMTTRVSVTSDGVQADGGSGRPAVSADGRFVIFRSFATNLVDDDTNDTSDVFVHDRATGMTTRVSEASDGTQGDGSSLSSAVSANGRFVVFDSLASNLVAADNNGYQDVFVHDRQTGTTTRVSVTPGGGDPNAGSNEPAISANGRFVAYSSVASNLVDGDTNTSVDVFVRDRQLGTTTRVSVSGAGVDGNGPSEVATISADGRFVGFDSAATNLVNGDTNNTVDVFVHQYLPNPPPPVADWFVDDDDSVFENAIDKIARAGITAGCNPPDNDRFCPNDHVTRGQMAAFLVRALGYTDDGGGDIFHDTVGNTFELAIDRLATAGVTVGCNPPDNDRFCPDDRVTRGQMAAFLVRAFGYSDDGGGDLFVDDTGSVFERAIDRLATAGVTVGCNPPDNDRFCPNDRVTRGQMAAFLARALGLP
jgi:hypothetical protein